MKSIILLTDIFTYKNIINASSQLPDRYATISPEIYFNLMGHKNIDLISGSSAVYDKSADIFIKSHQFALNIDRGISDLKIKYLDIGFETNGWHYLNFRHIYFESLRFFYFREYILEYLKNYDKIFLPIIENPQDYYFPSVITTKNWLNLLPKLKEIVGIKCISPLYRKDAYGYLDENHKSKGQALPETIVHIPTIFYENNQIKKILEDDGNAFIELESPFWNVNISTENVKLIPLNIDLISKIHPNLKVYLSKVWDLMYSFFSNSEVFENVDKVFSTTFGRIVERDISQLLSLHSLNKNILFKEISKLIISDHDAGLQGPLLTWAENKLADIEIYPHSLVSAAPTASSYKTTRHKMIKNPEWLLNIGPYKGKYELIDLKPLKIKRGKNIIILLNELDSFTIDALEFVSSLEANTEILTKKGYSVKIREKPSHKINVISKEFSADGNLQNYYDWADICISIGTPTSALLHFYKQGSKCIHLTQQKNTTLEDSFLLPENNIEIIYSKNIKGLWNGLFFYLDDID